MAIHTSTVRDMRGKRIVAALGSCCGTVRRCFRHSRPVALVVSVTLGIPFTANTDPVWAASWSGTSGVLVEAVVNQSGTTANSESGRSMSLIVNPFYTLNRESRSQSLTGTLGLRHQNFFDDGGQVTSPSLSLGSRTTLVERRFWINADANASSRRVSANGFIDDIFIDQNQTTTSTRFQVGPEFRYRPFNSVVFAANAAVGQTRFNSDGRENDSSSSSVGVDGSVQFAAGTRGYFLDVETRFQRTELDTDQAASLGSFSVRGVVPFSTRFAAFARIGYDQLMVDSQGSDESDEDISQEQYALGFRWQPNRRFELNAEYAERAFGYQPTVSMTLIGRRSQLEFLWSRDLQISQLINTEIRRIPNISNSDDEPSGSATNIDSGSEEACSADAVATAGSGCARSTFVIDLETVQETIAAIYTLQGRVSTLSFAIGRTELTDIAGDSSRNRDELQIVFSRPIASNLTLVASGTLSATQEASDTSDAQAFRTSLSWTAR